jgi:hypothetical protein
MIKESVETFWHDDAEVEIGTTFQIQKLFFNPESRTGISCLCTWVHKGEIHETSIDWGLLWGESNSLFKKVEERLRTEGSEKTLKWLSAKKTLLE